jgi:hypothetical protein
LLGFAGFFFAVFFAAGLLGFVLALVFATLALL